MSSIQKSSPYLHGQGNGGRVRVYDQLAAMQHGSYWVSMGVRGRLSIVESQFDEAAVRLLETKLVATGFSYFT